MGALHLAATLLLYLASLFFLNEDILVALSGIGITQLFWGVPLTFAFRSRGMEHAQRGVRIAIGVTILLNAVCIAIVMTLIP
ncbi:MAG TPA: hypothetical protein VK843_20065 [Planctomycetota bacterium]|nr:hypothetical protein [Planctomycetota bacterium]